MKKFILALSLNFILAINFSMCQASQVSIYDSGAKDMFDEITHMAQNELSAESFPYVLRNFRLGGNLDENMKQSLNLSNGNFMFYGCDLSYIDSQNSDGMVIFVTDDQNKVFSVMVMTFVDENASKKQQEKPMMMLLTTATLVFYSIMGESGTNTIIEDITQNAAKGQWGVWHGEKFINSLISKSDRGFILIIDATDGKN